MKNVSVENFELKDLSKSLREFLIEKKRSRELKSIAEAILIAPARLTEMITTNEKGEYKRKVTDYYLDLILEKRIMNVNQILQGRKIEDLDPASQKFIRRRRIPDKWVDLLNEAIDSGQDLDKAYEFLEAFYKKTK